MENIIEKIKGLDKKVLIGAGIGAAVLVILIIVLVIGLGNKPTGNQGGSQSGTQAGTETENGVTEVIGTEDVTEEIGTEITTETEMGTELESESESQTQGIGGTTVTQRPDVNGVEQKPVTTTPDGTTMLGDGSAANPYMPNFSSSMSYTTLAIQPGQTVYYSFMGAGNMWMSINDGSAFVIDSNGVRHNASGGKVGFTVQNALASDYVTFQIGNSSSTAKSFTITFANIKGSWNNPEKTTSVGPHQTKLSAGDEVGYHYKYTTDRKAAIRFYITAETSTCGLTITNLRNSAQRNFLAEVQQDEKGRFVELEIDYVEAGDEIMVVIAAEKYRGSIPAATVTWEIVYVQ